MQIFVALAFLQLVSSGSVVLVEFPHSNSAITDTTTNVESKTSSNIALNKNPYLAQIKAPVENAASQNQLSANVDGQQLQNTNPQAVKYLLPSDGSTGELQKDQYLAQIKAVNSPVENAALQNQLSANPVKYILPSSGTPVVERVHHSLNFFPYEQVSHSKIIQLKDYQGIQGGNEGLQNFGQSSQNYVAVKQQSQDVAVQNQPQLQANQQFFQTNSNSEKLIAHPGYLYFQPSQKVLSDPALNVHPSQKLISQSVQEQSKNFVVQSQPYTQSNQQFFQSNSNYEKLVSHPSYLYFQPSQKILSASYTSDSIQSAPKISSQTDHLVSVSATPSLQIVSSSIPNYSTSPSLLLKSPSPYSAELSQHYMLHSVPLQSTSSLATHKSSAVTADPTVQTVSHQKVLNLPQPQLAALKTKVYEIRRPAVQQHIYDVEERVIIRPAGSVVLELDQPGIKTEMSQLVVDPKLNYSIQGSNQVLENAYQFKAAASTDDDSVMIQTARLKQANDALYQSSAANKNVQSSAISGPVLVADGLKAQQLQQTTTATAAAVGAEKIPQYQDGNQNLYFSQIRNSPVPFMIAIGEPDFGQYSHNIQTSSALKQEASASNEYNKQYQGGNVHEYHAALKTPSTIRGDIPQSQGDDSLNANIPTINLHQTQNINSANYAAISNDKTEESNSQVVFNNQKQLAYTSSTGSGDSSQIQNGSINAELISGNSGVENHAIAAGEKVYTGKIIVSQPVETVQYVEEHEPLSNAKYQQSATISNDQSPPQLLHHETNGKILKQ